jgi:hypothetical protein
MPTWSKVMRELTHSVLFSAKQVTTSGTISALTRSPVIVSRHLIPDRNGLLARRPRVVVPTPQIT